MSIIVPCPGCFDNVSIPWKPDYVVSNVVCGCGEWITLGKEEAEYLMWEQKLEYKTGGKTAGVKTHEKGRGRKRTKSSP